MDCSPPGSSVHGILQAKILEWGAISSPRGPLMAPIMWNRSPSASGGSLPHPGPATTWPDALRPTSSQILLCAHLPPCHPLRSKTWSHIGVFAQSAISTWNSPHLLPVLVQRAFSQHCPSPATYKCTQHTSAPCSASPLSHNPDNFKIYHINGLLILFISSASAKMKVLWRQGSLAPCTLIYPMLPVQRLEHCRTSINICWMNECLMVDLICCSILSCL